MMQQVTSKKMAELGLDQMKKLLQRVAVLSLASKVELREGSHDKLLEMIRITIDEVLRGLNPKEAASSEETGQEHSENF
jgi:hypothetical protein